MNLLKDKWLSMGMSPETLMRPLALVTGGDVSKAHYHNVRLFLPSELNDCDRRWYCPSGLAGLENRLRYAEATDALENLHHHLRTHSFTNRFKIANVTGQINNTRSRETQNRIDDKVRQSQLQYCHARTALLALRGKGEWEQVLQVLERSDIRALNERQMTEQEKDDIERVRLRAGVTTDGSSHRRGSTSTFLDMVFGEQSRGYGRSINAHRCVLHNVFFCPSNCLHL
jgi:hypothetical protein